MASRSGLYSVVKLLWLELQVSLDGEFEDTSEQLGDGTKFSLPQSSVSMLSIALCCRIDRPLI